MAQNAFCLDLLHPKYQHIMTPKAITILLCFLMLTLDIQAQTGQPREYDLAPRVKVHVQLMTIDNTQAGKPMMKPLCNTCLMASCVTHRFGICKTLKK